MLVSAVRDFVTKEFLHLEDEIEETGQLDSSKAKAIFQKSKSRSVCAMNIPEEFGRSGLSAVDICLFEE